MKTLRTTKKTGVDQAFGRFLISIPFAPLASMLHRWIMKGLPEVPSPAVTPLEAVKPPRPSMRMGWCGFKVDGLTLPSLVPLVVADEKSGSQVSLTLPLNAL